MEEKAYKDTIATRKIFQLTKRIRAVAGGTWASKTVSILIWLIDYAQSLKNQDITVVAESVPHLDLGAIKDFRNILQANGYWEDKNWNASQRIYTFPSGSQIKFVSFDKFGKAHGPRRDVLFINEANHIPYEIADQLITRTRKIIWLDWNPSWEFWFYTEFYPNRKADTDFITLTYRDVIDPETKEPILTETEINEIESHRNSPRWWKVYGEGQLGDIEGRIYTDWQIIDEIPKEARLERYGLDFGYTNDYTAISAIYYYNGGWILDEVLYRKGMSNKEIADTFKAIPQRLVIADSAEPKSIDEIRAYGVNIQPCKKGKDSVRTGIQMIQDQKISITKRSINGIKEYRNYLWAVDKYGEFIKPNEPEKGNDHFLDAVRYALETSGRLQQEKDYWDRVFEEELTGKKKKKVFNKAI